MAVTIMRGDACISRQVCFLASHNLTVHGGSYMSVIHKIALALLIIGGINWGLVGLFQFDLVAWLFGGADSVISRIIYTLVGLSGIWCIALLFKDLSE